MYEIIIGDVHGCLTELRELLEKLDKFLDGGAAAQLIFCGDLLDKGPDPYGVLSEVASIPGAVLVMGNHEERFVRYLTHERRIAELRKKNPKQMPPSNPMKDESEELRAFTEKLSQSELDFLLGAKNYHRLNAYGHPHHVAGDIVVHGGIAPAVEVLPAEGPVAGLTGKDKELAGKMCRTRYVSPETGKFVPLNDVKATDPFWFHVYDGRFGFVYFGHIPIFAKEPPTTTHTMALDLGCVHGGKLAAVVLKHGKVVETVTVDSIEEYCDRIEE